MRHAADAHGAEQLTAGLAVLKDRLEEIMRRPKVTARDAEEAAEAAQALADLLRAEDRALRVVKADVAPPQEPGPYLLTGLTLHEAARRVLEESGWPMHVRELGARIKSRGWRHPRSPNARPDQINYQLAARLPRHPETFRKFGPNTFGLAAWGETPPQSERPRPHLGLFSGGSDMPSARCLSEHPEEWYPDMVES